VIARTYAAIAAGSAIGSLLRWSAGLILPVWFGSRFPWETLFVNLSGSFLICYYAARFATAGPIARAFMMSGVCGGYTTFSLLSLEMFNLLRFNAIMEALTYAGLTIAGALGSGWLGTAMGRRKIT
jgi:CrcB protein